MRTEKLQSSLHASAVLSESYTIRRIGNWCLFYKIADKPNSANVQDDLKLHRPFMSETTFSLDESYIVC